MNISRNPVIAYQQGYKEGQEIRRGEDVKAGMNFVGQLLLVCMYNANEDLSAPKLAAFYERLFAEIKKHVAGYIVGEDGLSTQDEIDLMCSHDATARRRLKLPPIDYDNRSDQFII